jgi:DNA replication and repair protein RecF
VQIRRISLANFRLYPELELELQPALNFFEGENGQGKTALLEAIYCLATSRSFRTSHEQELVRWGESTAWVRGELCTAQGSARELALSWSQRPKWRKELSRQGQKVEKLADFLGELPLALFVPEDLNLVQGGPAERRRYLDLILCKLYPAAVDCLGRFQKVLAARNALLKRNPPPPPSELEPWNLLLAPLAADLVERRTALLADLTAYVDRTHQELADRSVRLELLYRPKFVGSSEEFFTELERREREDLRRGTTSVGPHRDDFELRLEGVDMRQFGSQGQCRSLALALRLAQASYLQAVSGEPAVVLLDDCLSELDPGRQERLLRLLCGFSQVAVTSATPVQLRAGLGDQAQFYRVEGGQVKRP